MLKWKNTLPRPQVEGEAQGPNDSLNIFLSALNKGPTRARVERVSLLDREVVSVEEAFEIRH